MLQGCGVSLAHAFCRAGDNGSFVGGDGRIGAVTDKALLALLDEVRLSGTSIKAQCKYG